MDIYRLFSVSTILSLLIIIAVFKLPTQISVYIFIAAILIFFGSMLIFLKSQKNTYSNAFSFVALFATVPLVIFAAAVLYAILANSLT